MTGYRIMSVTFHFMFCHIGKEILRIRHLYLKEVEYRVGILRMSLECKFLIGYLCHIALTYLAAAHCPLIQIFKADGKNSTLNSFKSHVVSNTLMIISYSASLVLKHVDGINIFFVV